MLAALGRFAHRRRRLITTFWAALLVLGFTVGVSVFNHLSDSDGVTASESARGMELLKSRQRHSPGVVAVVSGVRVTPPAPAPQAIVEGEQDIRVEAATPLAGPGHGQIAVRVGRQLVYVNDRDALESFVDAWRRGEALADKAFGPLDPV